MARDRSRPELRNPKTTMWILATSATKPMMHMTSKILMTTRTNGMSMTPPPGAMISEIMDDMFLWRESEKVVNVVNGMSFLRKDLLNQQEMTRCNFKKIKRERDSKFN